MRASIQAFNQIYTRLTNANNHLSGANDATIQARALQEYQCTTGPAFQYLTEWEFLRTSSKFSQVVDFDSRPRRAEPAPKRTKTTSSSEPQSMGSDARVHIDLNSTEEEGETDRYIRPTGRDAAKKTAHAGSSAEFNDTFQTITGQLEGLIGASNKRAELSERKIRLKELKMLATDYSHLDQPEREIMEQMKREIREKYGR